MFADYGVNLEENVSISSPVSRISWKTPCGPGRSVKYYRPAAWLFPQRRSAGTGTGAQYRERPQIRRPCKAQR